MDILVLWLGLTETLNVIDTLVLTLGLEEILEVRLALGEIDIELEGDIVRVTETLLLVVLVILGLLDPLLVTDGVLVTVLVIL